jgi:hypothetical protein
LGRFRHEVDTELAEVLVVFTAIDSETDALPIGEVRQLWSPEALERKDHEITKAEHFYHCTAREAATRLIQLLERTS